MGSFDHVLIYEDQNLQAKARNLIPVKDLTDSAIEKQTSLLNQGETVQLKVTLFTVLYQFLCFSINYCGS